MNGQNGRPAEIAHTKRHKAEAAESAKKQRWRKQHEQQMHGNEHSGTLRKQRCADSALHSPRVWLHVLP